MKIVIHLMLLVKSNNYLHRFMFLVLISILLLSCHKEKPNVEIESVTGFQWKVYTVQGVNDNYINPVPIDWQFDLKSDQTFLLKLGSSVCSGTYSWAVIDTASSNAVFTIDEWVNPQESSGVANKLQNIIGAVNKCYLYKRPFFGHYPEPPLSATMVLQFRGSAGFFYVYR